MIVQTFKAAEASTTLGGWPVATVCRVSATMSEHERTDRAGPSGSAQSAVAIRHVSKTFRLPHQHYNTLKERALHPFRSKSSDLLRAVQDVSVEIAPGEFFGIVGRNGSGKSTLLKCLAGIYRIDEGELTVNGRLSPFIELGVGFNPDLTARDNVIINAIMLGLSRKEAGRRFDDILAFAELEEFVDLKLKNYSSGMHVRLAFATAVQVDAEILLIDEVLAVGDAAFQQKCFDEFMRLRREGRTILFVTHDMSSVERFCDRALLLDRGRVVDIADPASIARQYNQLNFALVRQQRGELPSDAPARPQPAQVLNAWFESPRGNLTTSAAQGEACDVRMDVQFMEDVEDPIFSVSLQSEAGHYLFVASTESSHVNTGRFRAGTVAEVRLSFENHLAPGRYRLFATVARAGLGGDVFDAHISSSLIVIPIHPGGGMADLPHGFEIERR
jgi:ABC-type polysaccharide/polyol phosphate transport system ATPase subunit